jgi:hypothetical protein
MEKEPVKIIDYILNYLIDKGNEKFLNLLNEIFEFEENFNIESREVLILA